MTQSDAVVAGPIIENYLDFDASILSGAAFPAFTALVQRSSNHDDQCVVNRIT